MTHRPRRLHPLEREALRDHGAALRQRRAVLRGLGIGTAGLATGGLGFLAGCSSDDKGSSGSAGSSTTPAPAGAAEDVVPDDPDTPYWLQGNFVGVTSEETATDLTVKGSLPPELSGLFVRNGSNPEPGVETLHWFLGDGMIHGVRLEGGKASWYRNRYVQTPIRKSGKDLLNFGKVPGGENSQSNVALIHHGGKLLAVGEVGWPWELSTDDLSTVGAWNFGGRLGATMTAHPKIDPETGRMHFFGYDILEPKITYYAAAPDGTLDVATTIPVDAVSMIHDFAITDRHAVFWLGPVMFGSDPKAMYPDMPFHWDPEGPCRVGVMSLDGDGSDLRWVDIPPCFVFHGYNAHTDGDDVVLRVSKLPSAFGVDGDLVPTQLTEWRVGTGGADLTFAERALADRPMDLPSHDRRHTGRETRHAWFATVTDLDSEYGFELAGVVHVDLETGKEDAWEPPSHLRSGEGFFVPTGKGEGEGCVLTYIWDRTTNRSSLGVFDAQDVKAGPVAEVELPVRVPFGCHGVWVGEDEL